MKFSPAERLILMMLADIHKHLKISGEIDAAFVIDHLGSDEWAFGRKYQFLSEETTPADVVNEVYDILNMWRAIEPSFQSLPPKQQDLVKRTTSLSGVEFEGFDNLEPHLHVARIMIERLGLYAEFKGRDLDTHGPTIEEHRVRFKKWKSLGKKATLSEDELIRVLGAGIEIPVPDK